MSVALTSEVHGSDDICHASALRDQGGMPVDEAFQILRPSSYDTSAGRRRSPRQLGAGPSGAVSSSPAVISPVLILVPKTMRHPNALVAVDDDQGVADVDDTRVLQAGGAGTQSLRLHVRRRRPHTLTLPPTTTHTSSARGRIGLVHQHGDHHRSGLDDLEGAGPTSICPTRRGQRSTSAWLPGRYAGLWAT